MRSVRSRLRRPFVFLNVATTVDGKLAPANRHFIPFSSKRDQRLLMRLRTDADAVMAGARTVDLAAVDLGPGSAYYRRLRMAKGRAEYNLRIIVSGSGSVDPRAAIFQRRFSPIIVLASEAAPRARLAVLANLADEVKVMGRDQVDFRRAFEWLREKWNVRRLLCEGGGEVNAALFRAGLVDEVYWTISPLVFGGRDSPTMADSLSVQRKEEATRLRLISLKRFGHELFLVYRAVHRIGRA